MSILTEPELRLAVAQVSDGKSLSAVADKLAHERSPRCNFGKKYGGWKGEPYAHSRGCFMLSNQIMAQIQTRLQNDKG